MTNFWLNDLTVLFNRNNLLQIIPYSYLSLNDKLNLYLDYLYILCNNVYGKKRL